MAVQEVEDGRYCVIVKDSFEEVGEESEGSTRREGTLAFRLMVT